MRHAELPDLIRALRGPVDTFVHESRARIALLVNRSGQVLAQHGFTSSYETMNVASLAAAAHASSRALAELVRAGHWKHLYHGGRDKRMFLAPLDTPLEPLILVVIFDAQSSLGLIELFFQRLEERVAAIPQLRNVRGSTDAAAFERDLDAGLERIFHDSDGAEAS
jgi:predicted regulator of Ras-like GTPase activity (Roadblock/LC7/MglB family)